MSNGTKVLIVDDDATWTALYVRTLEKAGYRCYVAHDLDAALKLIDRHFFHVALIDIVLNERDQVQEHGMQLLERLQQTGEKTGLVTITSYPTFDRMDRAYMKYQVSKSLRKQIYEPSELLDALAKASEPAKAYLELRKEEDLRPQYLLRGSNLQNLEIQLLGHGSGRLLELLQSLVRPFAPVLVCRGFERVDVAQGSPVFETRYWSRLIGDVILLRLGQRKPISNEADQLKQHGQDVSLYTRQSISGLRYAVNDMSPNDFRDCAE